MSRQYGVLVVTCPTTHLDMQPNIPNLERSPLPNIYADEVGRILIKDVNMPQSIQKELLSDRA